MLVCGSSADIATSKIRQLAFFDIISSHSRYNDISSPIYIIFVRISVEIELNNLLILIFRFSSHCASHASSALGHITITHGSE
jgi:hypothetical protein